MTAARFLAALSLVAAALPAAAPAAGQALTTDPHASAFVVPYRCDGGRWLVVAYPAPFARGTEPPARLAWNGETVLMSLARSGSGARYVNKKHDLEWWNKGRGGTLYRLSDRAPLLANCVES
jgi:membrane-bound inhibitor of C-type lysozyme